jgi:hypothetical protein
MRSPAAFAVLVISLPAAAQAAPRWTFCVAAAEGGGDVWISDVFMAERDRDRLEDAFRSAVARLGATNPNAQCPLPREDKTVAVNAQIDAEAFNRRLGATLHPVPASAFASRR